MVSGLHDTSRADAPEPLLRLRGLEMVFPNGTAALKGVDLTLRPGAVHGLLGANGAGKSTLIKILSGAFPFTAGEIVWRGERVRWTRPADPKAAGVATLHQHVPLVPTLSVIENVFLGARGAWRRDLGQRAAYARLLATLDYTLDPDALVGDLPIGQRQIAAILQALAGGADLIVMDEPTASLAEAEREVVYAAIQRLSGEGKAILFVSHFLDEIVALTDEVTVLRDGRAVLHAATADLDEAGIAAAIAGREIVALSHRAAPLAPASPLVEIKHLASPGRLSPLSLSLQAGEVVGIAGLLGSGRSELLHAIYGADPHARGEVRLAGDRVARSPGAAVRAGIALVPEDRARQGLIPGFELWKNITLPRLNAVSRSGLFLNRSAEVALGEQAIGRLSIKAPGPDALAAELSGGNAQKITIARWLFGETRLLLLDEPTAGIDIGAKTDILRLVGDLAAKGMAVILVSSEFEELLAVCHRILVMREGSIVAERAAVDTDEETLILLASGSAPPTPAPVFAGAHP